ncbi:hypothetical protein DFH08DRAFT_861172 [Mycena albidolilacea]|uniref:BTB domain-containing protein n=1 Tax=Mycena albidolilacea TaxID=1033008 RepID=A0AAD7A6S6_9AGAR|nr:hypothetical protein DFH08DRAFT_861172 [Mycena albidolilacea]
MHLPVKRSNIWYTNGSVILQAEGTQFRVHWGVLSENSPFFRHLSGFPQPSTQHSVDGYPTVELLGDSVADVSNLLKALYSPTFLAQTALPLPAIGALVRLGCKYEYQGIRCVGTLAVHDKTYSQLSRLAV